VLAIGAGIGIVISEGTGSNGAAAQSTTTTDTVSVSGRGSVAAVPDTLVASLHVHTIGSSVQSALDASSADARKVINALKAHGVALADIKTTDLSLNPHYDRQGNVDGYQAGESLNARIHPLGNVDTALTAAVTAPDDNSVNIGGLSLTFADNSKLLAAARANAFANAKAAAAQYAQLGGTTLAHVQHITSVVHNASPVHSYASAGSVASTSALAAAPGIPIRAGQQKVSVTVNVIWALS
jgi:uncharacterized protein